MLTLILKKCTFRTQLRQFTVLMCSESQVKKYSVHCPTELKCTNLNPNFTIHNQPFCTASGERVNLPPLMDEVPLYMPKMLPLYRTYLLPFYFESIDPEFNQHEFMMGTTQATIYISDMLATQRYDELIGLVSDNTITILKRNINRLTKKQKELIKIIDSRLVMFHPWAVNINDYRNEHDKLNKDATEDHTVEVIMCGVYCPLTEEPLDPIQAIQATPIIINYIFRRRYTNKVGEHWKVVVVNHFALSMTNLVKNVRKLVISK